MSPDAALASLAAALEPWLGDNARQAATAATADLHREGWHITAVPPATGPRKEPTMSARRYPIRLKFPIGYVSHLARYDGTTLRLACGEKAPAGCILDAGGETCRACTRRVGRAEGRWERYASPEEKFAALVVPTTDGHARWDGPMTGHYPNLIFARKRWSVLRLAFLLHYGREPEGTIRTGCDRPGCILGAHLDDTAARVAHRRAYAALGL